MKIIPNFIKNTFTNNTTETYSCNYINDCNTYSTDETFTGKYWIDGKKIYRKVISGTGKEGTIGSITNLDQIINVTGLIKATYNQWWSIPNYYPAESRYWTSIYVAISGDIGLSAGDFYTSSSPYVVTVEYTKTSSKKSNNEIEETKEENK